MRYPFYTDLANADFFEIILRSRKRFGKRASDRYSALIEQAILDLAVNPDRPGTRRMPSLGNGIYFYHIRHSRKQIPQARHRVLRPRHFIAFRLQAATQIQILRIVYDRRKFERLQYKDDQ